MPIDIDPETMNVDDLPGIRSPVQWEVTETERIMELENQAKGSLLYAEYNIANLGTWGIEIEPDGVSIYRL